MRTVHIGIFGLGVLSFLAAIAFIGQETGDTLWRAGIAFMLVDVACTKLWPGSHSA